MNILEKIDKWGVPSIILSLPLYLIRFDIFGIPFSLLEFIFWIVFIFWLIKNYETLKIRLKEKFNQKSKIENRKLYKYPFSFFIMLFVLSSFIGLAVAGFSNSALGIYKAYFIEPVLFFVLVFNYFLVKENREKVFLSLVLSALVTSLYAIFQRATGSFWPGGAGELRVTGIFPYPNALGLYLGPMVVLMYFYFLSLVKTFRESKKQKIKTSIVFLTLVLSFLAIYFAKSEAALGAILISIFFGSLFVSKRFFIAFALMGVLLMAVIFSNQTLKSFVLEKVQLKDFSGEVRKQQWRETTEMLKSSNNYLGACGLSGYQNCIAPYHQEGIFFNAERDPDFRRKIVIFDDKYRADHWRPVEIYMYPHNIFLNFWVELGIIGLIAFLGLMIQFFYFSFKMIGNWKLEIGNSTLRNKRIIIIGIMASIFEVLIHGLVDVPYFKNDLSFLFWLLFAMMGVYWIEIMTEERK